MNTKTIYLTGTQAKKIGSQGFGKKNNCRQYLLSTTLSPLNEKFFAMIFNEVVFNKIKYFELNANGNNFQFEVWRFARNDISTKIVLNVSAFNCFDNRYFAEREDALSTVEVVYKNGGNIGQIRPQKDAGKIKEMNYNGIKYPLADFVELSNGKKIIKKWYYSSYSFTVE